MDYLLIGLLATALFATIGLLGTALFSLLGAIRELRTEVHAVGERVAVLETLLNNS